MVPFRALAPSTLGTFLRAFSFGHVRQLEAVVGETLRRAWSMGAGPGAARLVVDVDSTICEVAGQAKHGVTVVSRSRPWPRLPRGRTRCRPERGLARLGDDMKLDRTDLRNRGVDANDGIIATAGIVEGFLGAGARGSTIIVAAFAAMVSGGIALGGAKFSEEAAERDAERALIEEERQQLTVLPHEELTELAEHYRTRGLSPDLAAQVAAELSAHDALAAHVVAEHGIDLAVPRPRPVVVATTAGLAFAIGAAVPLLTALLAPHDLRAAVTFLAVALSLCVTSYIVARAGGTAIGRTIARTVVLGILTMTITVIGGSFFTP